jgi:hypothetical protein
MSKPGPKTPWHRRVRYRRARCLKRLKPCQVENLSAADAFARQSGKPLNQFLTVRFEGDAGRAPFARGMDRLSKWFARWGGELRALYVWEAIGGLHVHCLLHIPSRAAHEARGAIEAAFGGHDVDIRPRMPGPGALAYIVKGTDAATLWKVSRASKRLPKAQGVIPWKRCGTTQNLGRAARIEAGFEGADPAPHRRINCAETSPGGLDASGQLRTGADASASMAQAVPSYVVLEVNQLAPLPAPDGGGACDASRPAGAG